MSESKPIMGDDQSGVEFAKEMLGPDGKTAAINFDRLQKYRDQYIIFEYLLTEEEQFYKTGTTPFSSHPNRYKANYRKFQSLWAAAQKLEAKLYLVNYAKAGTRFANEILLMDVHGVDDATRSVFTTSYRFSREAFKQWFKRMNDACLYDDRLPLPAIENDVFYIFPKRSEWYHTTLDCVHDFDRDEAIRVLASDIKGLKPCIHCCPTANPAYPLAVPH